MVKQLGLFGGEATPKQKPTAITSGHIPDQTGLWYQLEINTLESMHTCKCEQVVSVYKRQYHDCHTGKKVQSYYISPCACRSEHFDKYQHANESGVTV